MEEWVSIDLQRLLIATGIGAIIGAEREYQSKSAGLRTMILVCLSSALFTILSKEISPNTPDRIAANIITGIGFLGAGLIFRAGDSEVTGMTTATSIWMVTALGMAVGAGYIQLAVFSTIIVMIVLQGLIYMQRFINTQLRSYKIVCPYQPDTLKDLETLFKEHHLKVRRAKQVKTSDSIEGTWLIHGKEQHHETVIEKLLKDKKITALEFEIK